MIEVMIRFKIKKEYYNDYEDALASFLVDVVDMKAKSIDVIEEDVKE